uniref:Fibrinogen beta chain n=1 Tax=Plecoglossus altivelis TaxID=61084 RepID=F8K8M7_PLEAT|nr:fibrinogen beta chain precursor [Plecoglossus altivelis]
MMSTRRFAAVLLLCACVHMTQADIEYDDYEAGEKVPEGGTEVDPRGHRPVSRGGGGYTAPRQGPPPVSGRGSYRVRPTAAPLVPKGEQEKDVQPDAGGCTHASVQMGLLCPTGCELKTALLKQESNVRREVQKLKREVDELSRSSNTVVTYVVDMSNNLRERQQVRNENGNTVTEYTGELEEQHAYVKEVVDSGFPSNIRLLQSVLEKMRQKIQKVEKAILAQRDECKEPCSVSCPIPVVSGKECEDIFRRGGRDSQMYLIKPDSFLPAYKTFCDQTTQNGGWLLIHNRMDGSVDFGRRWDDYRRGFGNVAFSVGKSQCQTPGEYWLGNDRISQLTKMGPTEVLLEMQDWSGGKVFAQYRQFTVQGEASNYQLAVSGYSGTAGNTFLDGANELFGENRTMTIHNGMMFSTYDRDNDNWIPGDPTKQCSREDGGGWWYNRCHSANPNGRYYWGGAYTRNMAKHGTDDGMVWMNWKGSWYSLKTMSMKIRPFFEE